MLFRLFSINFLFLFFLSGVFREISGQDSLKDADGQVYTLMQFGDQIWMAQNLNTLHDSRGDSIESRCFIDNPESCRRMGRLYAWDALMAGSQTSGTQGICPDGWHIPSDQDWNRLFQYLGGADSAGSKLRKEYGFLNQFGGNYFPESGIFNYGLQIAYFWTSTSFNGNVAWMISFGKNTINASRTTVDKRWYFSVRCLKN